VRYALVDEHARVSVDAFSGLLGEDIGLVTIMHANNEVGTMQPIRAVSDRARACGAVVHTDAAQSVGKVRVDVDELGVDLLSIAGHKLNAPKGVGALYVRKGTAITPLVLGAGHERGLRPGTENVASIVGLGVACDVVRRTLATKTRRLAELRDRLGSALARAIPDLAVNAAGADRLPNTLSVRFPRARGSAVLAAAPDVAASTGSACHSGHESASGVLLAMGLSANDALETVRLSVGTTTTEEEVDRAASALAAAYAASSVTTAEIAVVARARRS
jgi:cysteine desulfurase